MSRIHQLLRVSRKKRKSKPKTPDLNFCPQKKGICDLIYTISPKKPNSAERKIAKVKLSKNNFVISYIPGEGHNLQQHSIVLVRGGKVKNLPGVKYHLVRGVYDFGCVQTRKSARSKYGRKQL